MNSNSITTGILSITVLVLAGYIAFGMQRNIPQEPPHNTAPEEKNEAPALLPVATSTQVKAPFSTHTPTKCVRTGCSKELCLSEADAAQGGTSVCWYKEEFACYANARCEQQANGVCGWTQTTELKQCIASKNASTEVF